MANINASLNLKNNETYLQTTINYLNNNFKSISNIDEISKNIDEINRYPNLDKISTPKEVYTFDEKVISPEKIQRAKLCVLEGGVFFEHTAAGEATRLGMGTKYIINISKLSISEITKMMSEEAGKEFSETDVIKLSTCQPSELLSLSLGTRHMIQLSYDITNLAKEFSRDVKAVLSMQKMLIILNEATAQKILDEFIENNFFGFSPKNIYFMIQKSFYGIKLSKEKDVEQTQYSYDENSIKRLHNHGQMVMQQTMDDEIFYLEPDDGFEKKYLKSQHFGEILKKCEDKISYNIEDIGYLTKSIDFESLAIALDMKERNYNMIMEIVANNPIKPQKGGMAAYDEVLKRNVMIESFQLHGIKNEEIHFLNKNFNHYPNPYIAWKSLKEKGLPMPLTLKDNHIYFQPIQGDINFLVKTQFVRRKELKPIENWKSPLTTPPTIAAMKKQDEQKGFKEFLNKLQIKIE